MLQTAASAMDITQSNYRSLFGSDSLDHWMEGNIWDNGNPTGPPRNGIHEDESSAKILEVDTWKPRFNSQKNQGSITSSSNYSTDLSYMNRTLMLFDSPSKYSP